MKVSPRWVLAMGAAVALAIPGAATASHWEYHQTDGDACPDAASRDTNANGRIDDFWVDLDQDCRWDSRIFNSRYDDNFLEEIRYDLDENGRPEYGLKDADQREGFDWFFADLDQDGRWGRWRVIPRSRLDYNRPNRMNVSSGMMHRFYQATGQSLLYGGPNPITSVYPRP